MLAFALHFYSGQPLQHLSGVDNSGKGWIDIRNTPKTENYDGHVVTDFGSSSFGCFVSSLDLIRERKIN